MTTLSKENIEALTRLQAKDSEVDRLAAAAADIGKQAQAQKDALEARKKGLALSQEKAKHLAVARKQKDLELAEKEAAIKKHQNELNAVKSNDAFKALMAEIETAKKEKESVEDAILQMMEESEALAQAEKAEGVQAKALEAETAKSLAELDAKRKVLEAEKAAREAERAEAAGKISAELLAKYEIIRQRRKGLAVVPAIGDNCGGCHMKLPAQTQVEIRKGAALVTCQNCQRILYIPDAPPAVEAGS